MFPRKEGRKEVKKREGRKEGQKKKRKGERRKKTWKKEKEGKEKERNKRCKGRWKVLKVAGMKGLDKNVWGILWLVRTNTTCFEWIYYVLF